MTAAASAKRPSGIGLLLLQKPWPLCRKRSPPLVKVPMPEKNGVPPTFVVRAGGSTATDASAAYVASTVLMASVLLVDSTNEQGDDVQEPASTVPPEKLTNSDPGAWPPVRMTSEPTT